MRRIFEEPSLSKNGGTNKSWEVDAVDIERTKIRKQEKKEARREKKDSFRQIIRMSEEILKESGEQASIKSLQDELVRRGIENTDPHTAAYLFNRIRSKEKYNKNGK